jgi:hypothetical protein
MVTKFRPSHLIFLACQHAEENNDLARPSENIAKLALSK